MALRLALLTLLVVLAGVAGLAGCTIAMSEQAREEPIAAPRATSHQWLGAGSCASAGCHNANGLKGDPRSEYTTWLTHDKHARAYEVLFNGVSRAIAERLYPGGKPAHEQTLCLSCHVHRDYAQSDHNPRYANSDGVNCESCHGPAGGWISEHYKPGWNRKEMWDTRSIVGRVQVCTACHVGAVGMDMNHDLIAAGHPQLAFEFSAYHAIMPHHWQDSKDREPGRTPWAREDWDAAAWFIGEALTTKAALELLAARAETKIWPEFAEYNCYACHHQLKDKNWRQDPDRNSGGRALVIFPWNDWYSSPLAYRFHPGKADPSALLEEIAALKKLMEAKVEPDRAAIRHHVGKAIAALDVWTKRFNDVHYSSKELESIMRHLAEHGATTKAGSWDAAAKNYLGASSVFRAWRGAKGSPEAPLNVDEPLKKIRGLLHTTSGGVSDWRDTPTMLLEPFGWLRDELRGKR